MKIINLGPPRARIATVDWDAVPDVAPAPISNMGGLPVLALDVIAQCLGDHDLANLAVTRRHLQEPAERALWRDLNLAYKYRGEKKTIHQSSLRDLLGTVMFRPWLADYVKELHIDVSNSCPEHLISVLERLPTLREFHMQPNYGREEELPSHIPLAVLLDRLSPLPTVRSLKLVLDDAWTAPFCRALEVMPNLTELSIHPAWEYAGGWGNHTILSAEDITDKMPTLPRLASLWIPEMHNCLEGPVQKLVENSECPRSKLQIELWDPTGAYVPGSKFKDFLEDYDIEVANMFIVRGW